MTGQLTRRSVLKTLATSSLAVGAVGFATMPVAARDDGELPPNKKRTEVEVYPFGCPTPDTPSNCNIQEVPAGEWVTHAVGWIVKNAECASAEEEQELIRTTMEKMTTEAWIDGEKIPNADQYWSDVFYSERWEQYGALWEYATPPKGRGEIHTFRIRETLTEPVHTGFSDDCSEEVLPAGQMPGTAGAYKIVPPDTEKDNGKSNRSNGKS